MKRDSVPHRMKKTPLAIGVSALLGTVMAASFSTAAQAQQEARRSTSALLEEVVVTARKREEGSQDVPLSISALGADQLEALKIRDLTNLSVRLPNVALDDVGTARGTANFSIRGLGVNSSIPGIDPTVGVVVDGVYIGLNNGILFDTFDLESVEVLRGPQGTLFGRNVTGGAVLLNSKKPGDEFEFSARAAIDQGPEGGPSRYAMASVGGPINDIVAARLTAYHNDDDGFVENQFDGEDIGVIRQTMVRPVVVLTPTDELELILRYEYGKVTGDGPVGQSHTNGSGVPGTPFNADRESFDVSIDEPGSQDNETNALTIELNYDVAFGEGTITNIYGVRDYQSKGVGDIDAQPVWLFHAPSWLDYRQVSNELRYNGLFADRYNVTTGVFYFDSEINYHERRELAGIATGGVAPAAQFDGGGNLLTETWAVFASVDIDLNEKMVLSLGGRYSEEDKEAEIASLSQNINSPCNIVTMNDCDFDFVDDDSWSSFSPKIGLTYTLSDDAFVYANYSQGTRSGGYNMRNTSFNPADTPGPFDQETVDSIELGYKSSFGGRGILNAAVFYNQIDDMQREINLPGPIGVIQLVRNTAEATIMGLEVDATWGLTDNLVAIASIGVLDASYDKVLVDLNGDGVIDGADKDLDLPRAADLTYTVGLNHDLELGGWGYMGSRISYSYRDESAYTDNNLGFINEQNRVDAGLDFYSNDGHWVFSVYGRNLLDEVLNGNDTQLPNDISGIPLGGTFAPLSKGRRIGLEVTYNL
ncbi:MAG: TonB-dependent receptor [Halieaceae bacterium]|jgi:iron complex outermembrane receptor protein|uniref:TonB-dependent receptor n=1 Tax=Haliea alexandrii TaxID=2448162 RepID=UPI000F0B3E3B|nr:TonB-dependent receptor [Haliea alexandrii]MCR9184465.1 TonB-dependent receptor [Halieaceae bacterium]